MGGGGIEYGLAIYFSEAELRGVFEADDPPSRALDALSLTYDRRADMSPVRTRTRS